MVSAMQSAGQSDFVLVALAVLNVLQTVWLADIAARSRRVRRDDSRRGKRTPERGPRNL
jgi:hypothetical protein